MSIIMTKTVTVNAAFLQEIKDVNLELWDLLRQISHLVSRPISIHTSSKQFIDLLSRLRDQLALHFALEEAYGYFEDPTNVEPWISDKSEQIRQEHKRLYLLMCEIVEYAELLHLNGRWASLATRVGPMFDKFHQEFNDHELREQELIMQSFSQDIGVGD